MKTVNPRFGLLFGFIAIALVVCALLLYFATPIIAKTYYVYWAVVATLLIITLSPLGKKRLASNHNSVPRFTFWSWWLRLASVELCLVFIYWGMTNLCSQQLLIHNTAQPHLFIQSLQHLWIGLGLLPFAGIALLSVAMGYVSYQRNQDAHISVIFYPLLKCDSSKPLGLILDSATRMATHITLATTLAMMIVLFLSLISTNNITVTHGFSAATIATTLLILVLSFTGIFKRYLNKMLSHRIPLFISISMIGAIIGLLIFIAGILFEGISSGINIDIPFIVKHLQAFDWQITWEIFSASWWLGWVPVCAALFAYYSCGRSFREVIIGVLALPLLFCMGLGLNALIQWPGVSVPNIVITLLALFSFIGLWIFIGNPKRLSLLIMSYLPKRDQFKHRDHYFFFRKNIQLALGVLYVFLPGGISVAYALLFMLTLPFCLILLIAVSAVIKLLL